jgi:PAS domain S-box-containing protein
MKGDTKLLNQKVVMLERELQEERQKNAFSNATLESGNLIIWAVDSEFNLLSYNQNYFEYFLLLNDAEYIHYELKGELKSLKTKTFWSRQYNKVLKGKSVNVVIRMDIEDGFEWKELFLNPVYGSSAQIHAISGLAYDITEKTESRIKLVKSEEKFRNIFESFQDLYFRTDFKGNITMLSPSVKDIMGYRESELKSKNITNFYIYNIKIKTLLKDLINHGSVRNFETGIVHKSGKVIPTICNIRIIRDGKKPLYIEGTARDITELKKTNEQLQYSKELAERSLKIKERFLANMSHEIKTPLNGIMGMIHLLDESVLEGKQRKHFDSLKNSSEILMNVLNDLLDMSKIEAGKMELKNSIIKTDKLLSKLKTLYGHEAKRNGINLQFNLEKKLPKNILTDEVKIIQIYSNLISNALKFTPKKGTITVSLNSFKKKKNGTLKLKGSVVDTGIGISLNDSKLLFKSFTQLDGSTSKSFKGTGLGLFISKKLAKMLGGKIGALPNKDKGTTFWFTFETIATSPSATLVEDKIIIELKNKPRVLLVDDNNVNLQLASEMLRRAGCVIQQADSGEKAIELAGKKNYQVILMDIQMPKMDGVTASKHIRKTELNKNTPIIAMTAYSLKGDKNKYLNAGLDDYISKPIVPENLIRTIKKWTEDTEIEQHLEKKIKELEKRQTLNQKTLSRLMEFGGKEMVSEALEEFDNECSIQLNWCKRLISEPNNEEILNILHTLKGNAGTLGVEKMAFWSEFTEDEVKKKNYHIFENNLKELYNLHYDFKKAKEQFNNN